MEEGQSEKEDEDGLGLPLPPIDPREESRAVLFYDHDTIIVRPPALPEQYSRAQGEKEKGTKESGRLLRSRTTRVMFSPASGQALMAVTDDPAILKEALTSCNAPAWNEAWGGELVSLKKNGTWVLERAPRDRNIVGGR